MHWSACLKLQGTKLHPMLTTDRNNNWVTIRLRLNVKRAHHPCAAVSGMGSSPLIPLFFHSLSLWLFFLGFLLLQPPWISWLSLTLVALVNVWFSSTPLNSPMHRAHPHRLHFSELEKWLSHVACHLAALNVLPWATAVWINLLKC